MPISRTVHANLSLAEIADRLALRELVDAYPHCADRRDLDGQLSLFTADAELLLIDDRSAKPTQQFNGRESLRPLFENLNTYETTTHFNGQNTVWWEADSASGVVNCLAHLVKLEGSRRTLTISCIRYLDQFVKLDKRWYFKQRKAVLDWTDNRPLNG